MLSCTVIIVNYNTGKMLSEVIDAVKKLVSLWHNQGRSSAEVKALALEHIQSLNLSSGFPIHSWKKYAYIAKSYYYKKFEIIFDLPF